MKYIILLFLMSWNLFANNSLVDEFMFYKTLDNSLTLHEIKNVSNFHEINSKTKFDNNDATYWIKVKLQKNLKSTRYMVSYKGYDFSISSILPNQLLNKYKFKNNGSSVYSFYYNQNQDSTTYYFKIMLIDGNKIPTFFIEEYNHFYKDAFIQPNSKLLFLLFGLVTGIMLMVSIYNLTIYFYYKEKSFLYYALMQFTLLFVMMYDLGMMALNMFVFYFLALGASLFATLFMISFFNMSKTLPKLNKLLHVYIGIISLDFIHLLVYDYSFLSHYGLFSIFGMISVVIGYLQWKRGFIPANFFLIGWSILSFSIFYTEHIGRIYGVSPLLIGSPLEALSIALALASKLKMILDEKKHQQELLVHQSKLASMGEMIGDIAHQWKQPLSYLSFNFMNLREASKQQLLDDAYLNKKLDKAEAQLEFMSQTIDNFKDFYLPNKAKESFSIAEATQETLEIMEYEFKKYQIEVNVNVKNDFALNSYKNEYKQVILNLLSNAKDAFLHRAIVNPKITINIDKKEISVHDNAGGIPIELIDDIFKAYVSSKKESSGIGLYMSKLIIENDMLGVLSVTNVEGGALFRIQF